MKRLIRTSLVAVLALVAVLPATLPAQTALNTTTLTVAVNATTQTIALASLSNIAVGHVLFVDREAMQVNALGTTSVTVTRGIEGTASAPHVAAALVYTGARERYYGGVLRGACTRTEEQFLPRIVLPAGDIWDCPVGAGVWSLVNAPSTLTTKSEAFNLDNGAGTTIDAVLLRPTRPIRITACRILYEDATSGTVAGGSAAVGTTVGGAQIVAATNYENAKAVGTTTAMTVVSGAVAAGTPVLVRHTGVAVTQAGESVIECDWHFR
ncbi:MAG: hypothetical protein ACRD3C_22575 [Vicinamibacterales bacterium]